MAAPINLSFIFAIFFLTLGPLKLIPAFFGVTQGLDAKARFGLALKSTVLAFLILVVATVVGSALASNWRVSREALLITGGFLLLIGSLRILSTVLTPPVPRDEHPPANPAAARPISIVISPLAIPGIITPWGLVALLLFVGVAEDQNRLVGLVIVLGLIMLLNIVGMIFAGPVMRTVGLPTMSVLGWVFSILQAALGVTFMLRGLVAVFGLPWISTPL
ncbi:MAG: MarC family protein [Caulobacter sp.]|nr:MarC family protein [Caulobacter sp.]